MGVLRIILFSALAVIFTIVVRVFVVEPIVVMSPSMEPTMHVGEHFLSDKITLLLRSPARGDIILFPPPTGADISVGKRVIAVPGDIFEIRAKKVFINGVPLIEPYAVHRLGAAHLVNDDLGPLPVPAGNIFVLGDNRDESEDSTAWKSANGKPIYFVAIGAITGLVRPWPRPSAAG